MRIRTNCERPYSEYQPPRTLRHRGATRSRVRCCSLSNRPGRQRRHPEEDLRQVHTSPGRFCSRVEDRVQSGLRSKQMRLEKEMLSLSSETRLYIEIHKRPDQRSRIIFHSSVCQGLLSSVSHQYGLRSSKNLYASFSAGDSFSFLGSIKSSHTESKSCQWSLAS